MQTLLGGLAATWLRPRSLSAVPANSKSGKPLNFVFFLVDDFGWMDIGANNPHCFYETPNIDRIARSGVNFTNGYAANPVCSPTRFSIMTGKYPTRDGTTNWFTGRRSERFNPAPFNNFMPLKEVTLGEAFKEHGYRTAFVGKWHLGTDEKYWPEHQGFDINIGGWSAGSPKGGYFAPFDNPRLRPYPKGSHLPKVLTDESLKILDRYKDGPFLLYLAFYSVHTPLQGRADLIAKYKAKRKAVLDPDEREFGPEEQVWPVKTPRKVRIRQGHPVYAAMVEAMDEQIGRVLDKIKELGVADHTAVILMSDNGGLSTSEGWPTSNLPLRGGKGWLYEGGIREPFMIRWPGVTKPGSTCDVPVISMDFYPTMLDMAGLPLKKQQHRDGLSLVPLLKGATRIDRDALYWHFPHYSPQGGFPAGAIRMGDWKLIERFEDGRVSLYDLQMDIGEREDLAKQYPQRVEMMRAKLHAWYKQLGAKFLQRKGDGPEPWRPA
jgi:arylsulfatase A-like enzyme